MGVAHFVVLERDIEGVDTFMNGKALAHADFEDEGHPTLTEIARRIGVTPLTDFLSCGIDDALGFMDLSLEDAPQHIIDSIPAETWFAADAGLETTSALRAYLLEHGDAVPDTEWVIADLDEIDRILTVARQHDVRWHLQFDI